MQHAQPNRLRRAVAFAVLAALLGLVSLTVTQCTTVGDRLTGVGVTRGVARATPTTCAKACQDLYADLYKLEQKRHQAQEYYCNSLSGQEQQNCKADESARHVAAKDQLTAEKIACQSPCSARTGG